MTLLGFVFSNFLLHRKGCSRYHRAPFHAVCLLFQFRETALAGAGTTQSLHGLQRGRHGDGEYPATWVGPTKCLGNKNERAHGPSHVSHVASNSQSSHFCTVATSIHVRKSSSEYSQGRLELSFPFLRQNQVLRRRCVDFSKLGLATRLHWRQITKPARGHVAGSPLTPAVAAASTSTTIPSVGKPAWLSSSPSPDHVRSHRAEASENPLPPSASPRQVPARAVVFLCCHWARAESRPVVEAMRSSQWEGRRIPFLKQACFIGHGISVNRARGRSGDVSSYHVALRAINWAAQRPRLLQIKLRTPAHPHTHTHPHTVVPPSSSPAAAPESGRWARAVASSMPSSRLRGKPRETPRTC